MRRARRDDRGAAAVEFALVVPVLLLIVLGIAELGRAYHVQTTLSGAARAGVRVMALENDDRAARTAARSAAGGLALTNTQISVTPTSCDRTGSAPAQTATVTITYPLDLIGGVLGDSITLTGTGVMRCNG
ncbi:pilus assembly protein [Desertihabitans brevis]|uniref:Pilus assembly protein n=1 Tax=Desertihabitans brevis TaxID=2268447 RepID=A0A367YWB6_9ACTN|nr:TadE/TadG family type IV pilus assembly protein [Desertihabitans brevis]RCK69302.1 pilus assembly protein [Desertihabitans brevis]